MTTFLLLAACAGGTESAAEPQAAVRVVAARAALKDAGVVKVTVRMHGTSARGAPLDLELPAGEAGTRYEARLEAIPVGRYAFHGTAIGADGGVLFESTDDSAHDVAGDTVVSLTLQQKSRPASFYDSAPFIESLFASSNRIGGAAAEVHLAARARDADAGDTLDYAWSDGDVGGTFTGQGTLEAAWTPPSSFLGDVTLTFAATDGKGVRSAVDIRVNVDPRNALWPIYVVGDLNHHPDIRSIGADDAQPSPGGQTFVNVDADDDGNPLTYAWTSSCGGFFDDQGNRRPRFTAPVSPGPCKLTAQVDDGRGGRNEGTIILNVANTRSAYAPQILVAFQTPYYLRPGDRAALMILAQGMNGLPVQYAWTDGGASGTFVFPGAPAVPASNALWTPPACAAAGDVHYAITVELSDGFAPGGAASTNRFTFPLMMHCP